MGMNLSSGAKGGGPTPQVNVTPLVDVALVVLIIFMVVTPLLTKTISLSLPPEADAAPAPPSADQPPLVMTVDRAGTIRLNREIVPRAELGARLPRAIAGAPRGVLHFDASDELPYGDAVAIVSECRAAGAQTIALVTKGLDVR